MALQRGLAAKDPKVARFAFVYTGLNYLVFGACVATFAVGITALFLAVAFPGVIEMVFFGVAVANAPLFFPMLLGLYGRKINHTATFLAIILTAVFNICSHLFWYGKVSGVLGEVHYYILGPLLGLAIMLIGTLVWPVHKSRVNNNADDDK